LPIELGSLELYGPRPAPGTFFCSRCRTVDSSARHFTHAVDVIDSQNRLWCRLSSARYWRFYVPFGEVNFHGPKDEYFISRPWTEAREQVAGTQPSVLIRLEPSVDNQQPVLRLATARVTMSPSELQEFRRLKGNDREINDWLFGRIAAKDAVRLLWWERHGERLFPADIQLDVDVHGRWLPRRRGPATATALPAVAVAHADAWSFGLAAFVPHVGLAVKKLGSADAALAEGFLDPDEQKLLPHLGSEREEGLITLWCAKQAVARALACDLTANLSVGKVRQVDALTGGILFALGPTFAATFPDLASALLVVRTFRDEDWIVAATFCQKDSA
jgi:hypothetical protein